MIDFERMVRAYWGTILSVDDSVGRLVAFLRETGQLDNTLVIFMGDNGLLEGEHGMVDKRTMHEPSIRIPLIARGPGLPADTVVAGQVLACDVAPSILDLCAAPSLETIDGRSWRKLCHGDDPDWRTAHAATRADLEQQLADLLAAHGLTPETDTMPLDDGIKTELPAARIR